MLPFCGYNMGDYFQHWLDVGAGLSNPPPIFYVNWFAQDADGRFLWPGFGENSRVLKWIFERCAGTAGAEESPIGSLPTDLDTSGFDVDLAPLLNVDTTFWKKETDDIATYFKLFADHLPGPLSDEVARLRKSL